MIIEYVCIVFWIIFIALSMLSSLKIHPVKAYLTRKVDVLSENVHTKPTAGRLYHLLAWAAKAENLHQDGSEKTHLG